MPGQIPAVSRTWARGSSFHADPHPGNFLLPDPEHIAILDFGDVGHLTGVRKIQLEDLLLAVSKKSVDDVTDAVIDITRAPADIDVAELRVDVDLWLSQYLTGSVSELDTAGMLRSGSAILRRHRLTFPSDLALLFRVLLRLQGLGQQLGTSQSTTDLLEPYLQKMSTERLDPRRLAHHVARTARSWERLFTSLPDDLRKVLGQLRAGSVAVEFNVRDADSSVPQLVDGILAGASILAASQLLSRKTGPTVAGVSVPGVVSMAVGAITWHRLQMQRPGYRRAVTRILDAVKPGSVRRMPVSNTSVWRPPRRRRSGSRSSCDGAQANPGGATRTDEPVAQSPSSRLWCCVSVSA